MLPTWYISCVQGVAKWYKSKQKYSDKIIFGKLHIKSYLGGGRVLACKTEYGAVQLNISERPEFTSREDAVDLLDEENVVAGVVKGGHREIERGVGFGVQNRKASHVGLVLVQGAQI